MYRYLSVNIQVTENIYHIFTSTLLYHSCKQYYKAQICCILQNYLKSLHKFIIKGRQSKESWRALYIFKFPENE